MQFKEYLLGHKISFQSVAELRGGVEVGDRQTDNTLTDIKKKDNFNSKVKQILAKNQHWKKA